MEGRKKVIAVCITKAQDYSHSLYLQHLHRQAVKNDFKLIVFNSYVDFYRNELYDRGAAAVYNIINPDVIDAVIVQADSFYTKDFITPVIEEAQKRGIPVVSVNEAINGCYFIVPDFRSAYKAILNHVINDHNVTSTFFIAGRKGDANSEQRIACYKEVLSENGLSFSDSQLDYGDYWEVPTCRILDRLHNAGTMPQAVFCANDSMALTAMEHLKQLGYRLPEDVIVTGFDGLHAAELSEPPLTTCAENLASLAELSIAIIKRALTGKLPADTFSNSYSARIGGSCGCSKSAPEQETGVVVELNRELDSVFNHEDFLLNWLARSTDIKDLYAFRNRVAPILPHDSCLCLNRNLPEMILERRPDQPDIADELDLIFSASADLSKLPANSVIRKADMFPSFDKWLEDDTVQIISAVHSDGFVGGYICSSTTDLKGDLQIIKRVAKYLDLAFNMLIQRMHQQVMIHNLENSAFIDALTGLPNLQGVNQWYEHFRAKPENHQKTLAFSIYALPKYSYIMENYGIYEIEESIRFVANTLVESNRENTHISRIAEDEFLLIDVMDDVSEVSGVINAATEKFFTKNGAYNDSNQKGYFVEVNAGCAVINAGWNDVLETYLRMALGEMYQNRLKMNPGEVIKESDSPRDYYGSFNLLLDKNLFTYHFQPIVDAKTGAIFAYEALMRTTGGVNMSPLDVLATAKEYKRLYEIEKATMFNVMQRFQKDYADFSGCKVFINTIPGHFLNETDFHKLSEKYSSYLDCFVFELTEQDSVSDEELSSIRRLGKNGAPALVAIDDYGTGHSNIVNLLRYNPSIIKIDRFLIENIDKDPNKQMFVRNTIEFGRMNGIKVLAEGVETYEELMTVIDFGVNYIQGYYTARPEEIPVRAINPRVQNEIIAENIRLKVSDSELREYVPQPREEMDVLSLVVRDYNTVRLPKGEFSLKGSPEKIAVMNIIVTDETTLHLHNTWLESRTLLPCIDLRLGSRLNLVLHGDNHFDHVGIHVPEGAFLRVTGDGNLTINHDRNYSSGIGANFEEPCGEMIFDFSGTLAMESNGDRVVSIGGLKTEKPIQFRKGSYRIYSGGNAVVGIGGAGGRSDLLVCVGVTMNVDVNGHDIVCMGSLNGETAISSAGDLEMSCNGDRAVCLGSHSQNAEITISDGTISSSVHCDIGSAIGTIDGHSLIDIKTGDITAYGEGNRIAGIGSAIGSGRTTVREGFVRSSGLAAYFMPFGNVETENLLLGGNVLVPYDLSITAVNRSGEKLRVLLPKTDYVEEEITSGEDEYVYLAERDLKTGRLEVYLPESHKPGFETEIRPTPESIAEEAKKQNA